MYEDGRLRDALSVLDAVSDSDSLKREADELRAAIQRRLLEAARVRPVPSPDGSGAASSRTAAAETGALVASIVHNEVPEVPLHQFWQRRSLS